MSVEGGRKVVLAGGRSWKAEEVLVATGRRPNVEGLGLEEVGVRVGPRGIEVDAGLRTSVRSIYAAGDVTGRHLFTHSAAHEAARALRRMFFPGRGSASRLVPWCTFTDPELAHCGPTLAEAQGRYGEERVRAWRIGLDRVDRARAEGATDGRLLLVTAGERLVGAHALAPSAGELIHELALAISRRAKLRDFAGLVHVYPTYSTAVQQLAAEAAYERARRFSRLIRKPSR